MHFLWFYFLDCTFMSCTLNQHSWQHSPFFPCPYHLWDLTDSARFTAIERCCCWRCCYWLLESTPSTCMWREQRKEERLSATTGFQLSVKFNVGLVCWHFVCCIVWSANCSWDGPTSCECHRGLRPIRGNEMGWRFVHCFGSERLYCISLYILYWNRTKYHCKSSFSNGGSV